MPPIPARSRPLRRQSAARLIASERAVVPRRQAETNCYKQAFWRPLEACGGRLYFGSRQTVARLPGGDARVATAGSRIPFFVNVQSLRR